MSAARQARPKRGVLGAALAAVALVAAWLAGCSASSPPRPAAAPGAAAAAAGSAQPANAADRSASLAAWAVVYGVLQHPRCVACHPAGDAPLQGDALLPHAQNVQRGPAGLGLYAERCSTCHQTVNLPGAHMPPGAPNWHLPTPEMPLVFEHRSSPDLCRQLQDPAQNGHRTLEQTFEHMAKDPLVLWGWSPGDGRAPVSTPHDQLVTALRTWIDTGCGCPEK